MANKKLFQSMIGKLIPQADTINREGAPAYQFNAEHQLAQYAVTGCLNATFYASAEEQLEKTLNICKAIEPKFIAQAALFCREQGFMKDMPALLCAFLATKDTELLKKIFPRVINNGKMLRNFVQMIRSGVVGRKSLGTVLKKLVLQWIEKRNDEDLFFASVGNDPSLADIIKMVHPKPKTQSQEALFGYLIGKPYKPEHLPALVSAYEEFKAGKTINFPKAPMEMLTSLELSSESWNEIAKQGSWFMTLMNLNTFLRHKAFEKKDMVELIAKRLKDPQVVKKAKVFPYKIMVAYCMASIDMPKSILAALQDAMEISLDNVPKIEGKVFVCPDVSGSMASPATGFRKGSTSVVRCIDIAALVAGAVVCKNPDAEVLPFAETVKQIPINPRDSVMSNAQKLSSIGGGGTNCSAPLVLLNQKNVKGDVVIFISDNQSWIDAKGKTGTATMHEWNGFKKRNPHAKLICIDIQPYGTTQAIEREDILNIGGFSDQVFTTVVNFINGKLDAGHWVEVIKKVEL
jgi:60 kDa SS-A/Ro ribonucleoprotein